MDKTQIKAKVNNPEQKSLLPKVLSLSWPMMLEELVHTAVHYVDYIMVGSLGSTATAAVGCTSTVNWMIGATTSALGVGLVAFISQAFGAKDEKRARRGASQSILIGLVLGLIMTALCMSLARFIPGWMNASQEIMSDAIDYFFIVHIPMVPWVLTTVLGMTLEGAGRTKVPMKIALTENATNVIMNFFLIYATRKVHIFGLDLIIPGAGLKVQGAAIASAISITVGGILSFIALMRDPVISPKGYSLKPDRQILKPCLRIALPNMLQRLITSSGYTVFASMINALGTIPIAAHTIANTVESAFYIPGYGMQVAAATLSGNAIGANDRKLQRNQAGVIITLETGLMIITGGLLFIFAPWMVSIFTNDPETIKLGSTVLRMVSLSEPFYGVCIVTEGMLQGAGKTKIPLIYNIIGMWGVRILGTFICTKLLGLGLVSAWACMIAHNLLLFVLFITYYVRGSWNPLKDQ